jgi:3-methyladenine DNA glycosylase AlkD
MHPYHKEILAQIIKRAAKENIPLVKSGDRYVSTSKPVYMVRTAMFYEIVDDWAGRHPNLTEDEFVDLLGSLAQGETYNEFVCIGALLSRMPKMRAALDPRHLDNWLRYAQGWAEVDSLCQLCFTAKEVLEKWNEWKSVLAVLCKSDNIHNRRASLVLLTKPLRESDDPRLARMAFANIDKLKHEKEILITKAVSWLLRALIKHQRQEVIAYMDKNAETLPKIAIRETRVKLETGTKAGRSRATHAV